MNADPQTTTEAEPTSADAARIRLAENGLTNCRFIVGDAFEVATLVAYGVNTGAVHALAYPLGGEFHVAHGVSNAVLLPHVLEFNLPEAPKRSGDVV